MDQTAGIARQMLGDEGTEQRPPQTRTRRDGDVEIGHRHHAVFDQPVGLAPQSRLQTVRHVPRQFGADVDRRLPDGAIHVHRPLDRGRIGLRPVDYIDERDEMRRVERMANQHALGMLSTCRLDLRGGEARRARGEHGVGRSDPVEVGEELARELEALGPALLHEPGPLGGIDGTRRQRHRVGRGALDHQALTFERRPALVDPTAQHLGGG
jgi:hypothetical protein